MPAQVVLVPESAHGTNPATAAFAGYAVENIPPTPDGRVDLEALKARLGPDVAAVMITNPNTCGLFERDMKAISDAVHAAGAFVYCDGANFNAIVGRVRPGDLGVDAMHINLHKTFSTPHGGGGPGTGPVVFSRSAGAVRAAALRREGGDGFDLVEEEDAAEAAPQQLRPDDGVPRPDGHVHPRARLHAEPWRRWPAAGRRGCGAQRQLRAAQAARMCWTRRSRQRAVHARGAVRRRRLRRGLHHAGHRQGADRRGLSPDDDVFPAGGPRRDAGRTDREPRARRRSTSSSWRCAGWRNGRKRGRREPEVRRRNFAPRRRLDETQAARKPVLAWQEPDLAEAAEYSPAVR